MKRRGDLFAIGDVHGCADELERLLAILPIQPTSTVVFLGDYIDRGPAARQVVETILRLKERAEVVALLGNHEDMLYDFMEDPTSIGAASFILNGGSSTLASYADEHGVWSIPDQHMRFYYALKPFHTTDTEFFVHAGVPNQPLEELGTVDQLKEMLWIREGFLTSTYRWSKLLVHGHSVTPEVDIQPNRINLDTGCVFGKQLSAMHFPSRKVYSVESNTRPQRRLLRDNSSRRQAMRFQGAVPVEARRSGHAPVLLVTLDYSEIGMYVRHVSKDSQPVFSMGDAIEGRIVAPETKGDERLHFVGRVVRVKRWDRGFGYAVQIEQMIAPENAGEDPSE